MSLPVDDTAPGWVFSSPDNRSLSMQEAGWFVISFFYFPFKSVHSDQQAPACKRSIRKYRRLLQWDCALDYDARRHRFVCVSRHRNPTLCCEITGGRAHEYHLRLEFFDCFPQAIGSAAGTASMASNWTGCWGVARCAGTNGG